MRSKNIGVLEGMCCPECRGLGPYDIEVTRWVLVYDGGDTDDDGGDTEWESHSRCRCLDCGHLAAVAAFETACVNNPVP